jgi:DNA-binding NarL/FixJ family response regulator
MLYKNDKKYNLVIYERADHFKGQILNSLKGQSEFENIECFIESKSLLSNEFNQKTDLFILIFEGKREEIEIVVQLKLKFPKSKFYILCNNSIENFFYEMLRLGVESLVIQFDIMKIKEDLLIVLKGGGFISKGIVEKLSLHQRHNHVLTSLTNQEQKISNLLYEKKSVREISINLDISENTVRSHVKNIYKKLEINSKNKLIKLMNDLTQKKS